MAKGATGRREFAALMCCVSGEIAPDGCHGNACSRDSKLGRASE